jgi:serine/threonine-protein kinase
MAPEQASGDSVDARADIYALGVLIYRMLAGDIPFPGPTFTEILRRQLMEPPRRLDERRSDVARPLADLVQRMLETAPEKRPQSMREVEDVLQTLMTGQLGREVRWKEPPPRAPSLVNEASARTELRDGPPPSRPKPPVAALVGGGLALVAAAAVALVLVRELSCGSLPARSPNLALQPLLAFESESSSHSSWRSRSLQSDGSSVNS